ncbi:M15 family metallopeptidase [Serratia proteamaculans]|uniref:M15 family metallopeptidase n=1 Tax=Serratia proteamaculans TaxID=28151 RepID=UPI003965807F
MKNFILSERSEKNLQGVHPDLVKVIRLALAISEVDFCIIEGVRTIDRQRELKLKGHSQTLNSRHLTGHAADLAPITNKIIPWDRWEFFLMIANAMKESAKIANVPIIWGGDWISFKDGVHFELSREYYA